ncbi:hypothetical protein LEP1GSC016_1075 [Leptospira borgpetersenii serovar Hardjo-bovis str. Sponselee]|uniref:Uncharacterized protein n=2 Tax=Leptospira borgpetersenii TaxID=174 RepID=M6BP82_LEPBO|nr:hypothetical protein LEP1GSC016_1075 [Leptospira borgpetersenii serovar Hardjo-bovis str. Sponselee]EMO61464.1 hypothetical protein LEP1GSC133_3406 [Leptospira borgpetersenii serovar Pomona str. 200901868]
MEKREEFSVCSKKLDGKISQKRKPPERLHRFIDIHLPRSEAQE